MAPLKVRRRRVSPSRRITAFKPGDRITLDAKVVEVTPNAYRVDIYNTISWVWVARSAIEKRKRKKVKRKKWIPEIWR